MSEINNKEQYERLKEGLTKTRKKETKGGAKTNEGRLNSRRQNDREEKEEGGKTGEEDEDEAGISGAGGG
ncbi:hypothetical protein Q9L58_003730 [Maublancomyces gigas]|uniref:Uncharacterized protein n=1 Tax=Discina gigas TaxID=1032678 RepID=A0ABR3GMV6_9PEZI